MGNFEGPEKKLEVILSAPQAGLRDKVDRRWERVVRACGAEILKQKYGNRLDTYLLSESSLFVWDDRILIVTCGKTNPVKALPIVLEYVNRDRIAYIFYERKNSNFPEEQPTVFEDDLAYLLTFFPGKSVRLGPASGDHIHVFYYSNSKGSPLPDTSLQVLMHDIDPSVGRAFYYDGSDMSSRNRILFRFSDLYEAMDIDHHFFYPQGYSLNGMSETNYFTIRVTPQPEASYVSFESNVYNHESARIIGEVVSIFGPLRYSVVLTCTNKGQFADMTDPIPVDRQPGYQTMDQLYHQFDPYYAVVFTNFLKDRH